MRVIIHITCIQPNARETKQNLSVNLISRLLAFRGRESLRDGGGKAKHGFSLRETEKGNERKLKGQKRKDFVK